MHRQRRSTPSFLRLLQLKIRPLPVAIIIVVCSFTYFCTFKVEQSGLQEPVSSYSSSYECMEVGTPDLPVETITRRERSVPPRRPYMEMAMNTLVGNPMAGMCTFRTGCLPPHSPYKVSLRRFGDRQATIGIYDDWHRKTE